LRFIKEEIKKERVKEMLEEIREDFDSNAKEGGKVFK
jgi:hypothetical protein